MEKSPSRQEGKTQLGIIMYFCIQQKYRKRKV